MAKQAPSLPAPDTKKRISVSKIGRKQRIEVKTKTNKGEKPMKNKTFGISLLIFKLCLVISAIDQLNKAWIEISFLSLPFHQTIGSILLFVLVAVELYPYFSASKVKGARPSLLQSYRGKYIAT